VKKPKGSYATTDFSYVLCITVIQDGDPGSASRPASSRSTRRGTENLMPLWNLRALLGREKKCIAGFQPAKVVLTQKELSRLRCRRDAGATIFSHDPCLRGE